MESTIVSFERWKQLVFDYKENKLKIIIRTSFFENPIIAFLIIFPFIKVNALPMDKIEMALVGIYGMISLNCFIIYHDNYKRISTWSFFYSIILIIATLTQHGDIARAVYYGLRIFTLIYIIETYLCRKCYVIFRIIDIYLTMLLCLNFLFQLVDQNYFGHTPSGNYNNFFRSDNELAVYIFAYLAIIIALQYIGCTRFFGTKVILSYAVLLRAFCVSGIISMTIFLFVFLLVRMGRIKKLRISLIMCGYFLLHVLLIFGSWIYKYLDIITTTLFGKSLSAQRMYIWNSAMNNILQKPILGYGVAEGGLLEINYDLTYRHNFSTHNMLLEYLIEGGVVLFGVYVILIVLLAKRVRNLNNELVTMELAVLVGMLISEMSIPEIRIPIMYITYVLIYHAIEFERYARVER